MIHYRRPARGANCKYCGQLIPKGKIAMAFWIHGGRFAGYGYMHIHCVMQSSKYNSCQTQKNVTPKEAVKATREAVAELMVLRMTKGGDDDERD